ncbi:unnamed protein product [Rhizopus microsporus]
MSFKNQQLIIRVTPFTDSGRTLVFPVIECTLEEDHIIRVGRYASNKRDSCYFWPFRSKVVSRHHAEICTKQGRVYIRDTRSSSGTFLNNKRLCSAGECSELFELKNNDIIQLGIDYQGGTEEHFRCVRMRIQLIKPKASVDNFNLKAHESLQNLTTRTQTEDIHVDECCICLYAIAPFQALFVAPCSHKFHYKCTRPLLNNHPAFTCPLCRHYSELNADVCVDVEEVKAMLTSLKES